MSALNISFSIEASHLFVSASPHCPSVPCSTVVEFRVAYKESGLLVNGTVVLEKLQPYLGGGVLRGVTIKKLDTKGLYLRNHICILHLTHAAFGTHTVYILCAPL